MTNGNNPWGRRPSQSPPDLDKMLNDISQKINSLFKRGNTPGSGGNPKIGITILIGILAVFLVYLSVYQVQPGERAVVTQFGVHQRTEPPGLNFLIPFIENKTIVNIERVNKLEFGVRPTRDVPGRFNQEPRSNSRNIQSLMLTGDKNVIQFNWVVQYRIDNPRDYLFEVENPEAAIRDFSESVIRRLVGNRAFDYILDRRVELASESQIELQDLLNKYRIGVQIDTVQLLDVNPPDKVKAAFNEVNQADQDKRRLANEAQKLYNEKIYRAQGEAEQIVEEAKGYQAKRVNAANGDVSRFLAIYEEYKNSKEVTRQRMFIETMNEILPKAKEIVIMDEKQNILPLMNFGLFNKENPS